MRFTISVLNLYTFISLAPCVQRGKCSIECHKVMTLIEKVKARAPSLGEANCSSLEKTQFQRKVADNVWSRYCVPSDARSQPTCWGSRLHGEQSERQTLTVPVWTLCRHCRDRAALLKLSHCRESVLQLHTEQQALEAAGGCRRWWSPPAWLQSSAAPSGLEWCPSAPDLQGPTSSVSRLPLSAPARFWCSCMHFHDKFSTRTKPAPASRLSARGASCLEWPWGHLLRPQPWTRAAFLNHPPQWCSLTHYF